MSSFVEKCYDLASWASGKWDTESQGQTRKRRGNPVDDVCISSQR